MRYSAHPELIFPAAKTTILKMADYTLGNGAVVQRIIDVLAVARFIGRVVNGYIHYHVLAVGDLFLF